MRGFKEQCLQLQPYVEKVIDAFETRKESLVLEGVHLRVTFMRKMMKKYPNLIPFVVCIKS